MRHVVAKRGESAQWQIDSAGTGDWHIGKSPDPRTTAECAKNGISTAGQRARQLHQADGTRFDLLLVMDDQNLADVLDRVGPNATATIKKLGDFDPDNPGATIADPYYGGQDGFATNFAQVLRSCQAVAESMDHHA